jgi:NADH-quinone oxidoreductase subunit C
MSNPEQAAEATPVAEVAPPTPTVLETTLAGLQQELGEHFLGTRLDRGETSVWVELAGWWNAANWIKKNSSYCWISDLTAVDYLERDPRFDLSLIVTSQDDKSCFRLKTLVGEDQVAPSLSSVWAGANWYEREIFDLFGIHFSQHPNLRRILLPADYTGHPLRKDYPVTGPAVSVYR